MKGWLFLVIAIVGEVIATSALKSSEGFTKLAPSAVVIIGYGIAFYFRSLVLKSIPVGVAYAVWSGLGVVIITAIAWLLHGQKLDAWGFVGMGLIIADFLLARSPSWKSLRILSAEKSYSPGRKPCFPSGRLFNQRTLFSKNS